MKRLSRFVPLAAVVVAACQDVQQPPVSFDVSDGSAFGAPGNPHFFFLPPIVPAPAYSGTFDGSLLPYLRVEVAGPFADEGVATCAGPVHDVLDQTDGLSVDPVQEHYAIGWSDDGLQENQVYRLCVRLQPSATLDALLGFRDVQPTQGGGSVAEDPVYMFNRGSNLQIKLRVELGVLSAELCRSGTIGPDYDCTAQILDNNETAVCDNATCALSTPDGGLAEPTLFLIERVVCPVDGSGFSNWLDVDIPQYGGCMRITVFDPEWTGFLDGTRGVAAVCPDLTTGPPLYTPNQDESLQLHLQRAPGEVFALPPRFSAIDGDCVDPNPEIVLGPDASVGERLRWALGRGWRSVRQTVAGLFVPGPAYAFHTGMGGHTDLESGFVGPSLSVSGLSQATDGVAPSLSAVASPTPEGFQFLLAWALPSQMEKVTPLETVIGNVGDVVPVQVKVTDNGRTATANGGTPRPVRGASVHFEVVNPGGLVTPGTALSDGDGLVTVDWTLQPGGYLVLNATGFGVGVRPASGFGGFDALGNDPRELETGMLTFDAIACDETIPGLVQATVDGKIDALDNYANADVHVISVNLGGNNSSTGVIYVGNDCGNLYVAFAVGVDESTSNAVRFVFDNVFGDGESADDDILSLERDGSGWSFRDRYLSLDCLGSKQADCGPDDPGVPDGEGATGWNPGITLAGVTGDFFVYEMVHPLKSGDATHDMQVAFGDAIGFYTAVNLGTGTKGNSEWPDQKGRFKTYQEYVVRGPPIP